MTATLKSTLAFLTQLERNNNKTWFEEHRPAYESARGAVEETLECRDLLIESNENLVDANRMLDDLGKKKCPSQIKEKALIGVIVGISCLLIGAGVGVALAVEVGK